MAVPYKGLWPSDGLDRVNHMKAGADACFFAGF